MSSSFDYVRKRLSFSPSPSPSTASISSRLSKEEIDEILTSPYETGYTYSSSAAYKRSLGSTEFRHPQLCRRLKLAAPRFNAQTNKYDYYTFEDDNKPSYASSGKLNTLEKAFYKICHYIQVLIVFSITCLVFVWRTCWTALKYTGKWLLKYFIVMPLLGPYYAVVQYYYKAKYAYAASVYVYPRVRQWFSRFWHKYIAAATTNTSTTTIVTEVDSDDEEIIESRIRTPYAQNSKLQPGVRKTLSGSYSAYRNSPFKSIFWTVIWALTMGLVGATEGREQQEASTSGHNLRTRSQLKGILKQQEQPQRQQAFTRHSWNEQSTYLQQQQHYPQGSNYHTYNMLSFRNLSAKLFHVVFTPFKWLWWSLSWLVSGIWGLLSWIGTSLRQLTGWLYTNLIWIYWGGVPKAIYSYCFTRSVDSSQVVSHKQVFKTRSAQGQEVVKENRDSATVLYIRENMSNWLRWLLIGLPLLFLLWFLLYPLVNSSASSETPSHSALGALHREIDILKQELKQMSLQQSEHHQHTHIHHTPAVSSASEIAGLDAKIADILSQLMTSERQLILLKMKEVETRVLEKAKAEHLAVLPPVAQTLETNQDVEQKQQEHLDELEKEVDKKMASFMSSISAQLNEQNSKLFQELEQLRESYIKLTTEETSNNKKETKSTTFILERQQELDESLYLIKVRQLIKEYIQRYDADKTGLPDYALESSGGAVASIRCTVQYNERSRTQMIFGIPLWYSSYSPRSVIQRKGYGASAGECWAFVGPHGYLTIRLSQKINVTAVSYEHLPVQLSPDGHIQTAPKDFLIYSYQDVDDLDSRFLLGNFTYDDKGEPLQMFQMQHYDQRLTPVIELETISNYGAMVTCLYRFRVHGALPNKTTAN